MIINYYYLWFRKKSDSQSFYQEIDANLSTPYFNHPIKHTGLLNMSRNEFHSKSKVIYEGNQLYDFDSLLSKNRVSTFNIDFKGLQTKFNINPYSLPQLVSFEVSSDSYYHKFSLEVALKDSFALKSDTKLNGREIIVSLSK